MTIAKFRNDIKFFEGKKSKTDEIILSGLGQNTGGYFDDIPKLFNENLQYNHCQFSYLGHKRYADKQDKVVNFSYLRSPNIISFIAEVAGISEETIADAWKIIVEYEKDNNLIGSTEKNGNYVWGKKDKDGSVLGRFKNALDYKIVCSLIKEKNSLDEVREELKRHAQ